MTTIFVTATGTGVGKTYWSVALARFLIQRGDTVAARKPAESFDPDDDAPLDAQLLGAATGEAADVVCAARRSYPVALAPPMAATALGHAPFTIADLLADLAATDARHRIVEGAGGVRSPLAADGDNVDFARLLGADRIVLIADAGLGAINLVRLSVGALAPLGCPVVVVLNRFDAVIPVHASNLDWLRAADGCWVVTTPRDLADALDLPVPE
jgi:dethiobiotin synthetase